MTSLGRKKERPNLVAAVDRGPIDSAPSPLLRIFYQGAEVCVNGKLSDFVGYFVTEFTEY
jgi:hypothetical protein